MKKKKTLLRSSPGSSSPSSTSPGLSPSLPPSFGSTATTTSWLIPKNVPLAVFLWPHWPGISLERMTSTNKEELSVILSQPTSVYFELSWYLHCSSSIRTKLRHVCMRSHILIDFDFGQIFITSTCFTINKKKEMTMDSFSSNTLRIQIMELSTFHSFALNGGCCDLVEPV